MGCLAWPKQDAGSWVEMYPLADHELAVGALVEHWLRCRQDQANFGDLLSQLLACCWRGELLIRGPQVPLPWDRRDLLAIIRDHTPRDHGGMVFPSREEGEPAVRHHADGSLDVDVRPRIVLPADANAWTPEELDAAYAALASCSCDDYAPDVLPGLLAQLVHRDDFAALCDRHRWPRPKFWFPTERPNQGARAKAKAVAQCRRWLAARAADPRAWTRKAACRQEAMREFSGLTGRAFDGIWDDLAPAAWQAPGRRRDEPRR